MRPEASTIRLLLAGLVLARLARGRRRRPPLRPGRDPAPAATVSVVVPARDEAHRLPGCLAPLGADEDLLEVVVVDDESTDATARVAARHGARVVRGGPLPAGWAGKAWALQQGLEAARGTWVLFLDADTRPRRGLARALVSAAADTDVLSAMPRFDCPTASERLLHASMAATLPYRFGPVDVEDRQPAASRAILNGQCLLVRRDALLAAGGWAAVGGALTEDVALARALRGAGGRLAFVDAADLLEVRMYGSAAETWNGWPRSLMAPDATRPAHQALDLAVLWSCMALPLLRLARGRASPLDGALLALRLAVTAALARSYGPRGAAFWLSALADPAVVARLTWSVVRPSRVWRGRAYGGAGGRARRSPS